MYNRIYTILCWLTFLLAAPIYLLYSLLTGRKIAGLKQRLGFISCHKFSIDDQPRIWFHAASVGEVRVVKSIIPWVERLLPNACYIVTTMTEQGHIVALEQLSASNLLCLYAPIDLPWVVKKFIRFIRPTAYICLETELWPNMIKVAAESGIKLVLLNGRISKSSFKNYLKIRPLVKNILDNFLSISAIMPHDKDRFIALGASPQRVTVNGNAKYDVFKSHQQKDLCHSVVEGYRNRLNIVSQQPVFIAGSTHTNEEKLILSVYKRLKNSIQDLVLIIAPRHIRRVPEICSLLKENCISADCYSALSPGERSNDVVILDLMGELATLYSLGTYVFCGGSLVPKGGHNLMEPALWGVPPLYGPHMSDFNDAKGLLENEKAGFPVTSADDMLERIIGFHQQPNEYRAAGQRARNISLAQQGSAKRQALLIQNIL